MQFKLKTCQKCFSAQLPGSSSASLTQSRSCSCCSQSQRTETSRKDQTDSLTICLNPYSKRNLWYRQRPCLLVCVAWWLVWRPDLDYCFCDFSVLRVIRCWIRFLSFPGSTSAVVEQGPRSKFRNPGLGVIQPVLIARGAEAIVNIWASVIAAWSIPSTRYAFVSQIASPRWRAAQLEQESC